MKSLSKAERGNWAIRMMVLLQAIQAVQLERHTASMRELETVIGVSRQTIKNWLRRAERLGYVDCHDGQPRALELLPLGKLTLLMKKGSLKRRKRETVK